jgi:DNA-binding protein YbaB
MEDLIKALQIFLKYGNDRNPTNCDHDVLRVCVDPSVVSDEDKAELDALSFSPDESLDCFYSYRFGSN